MPKFSANISTLYPELPFFERIGEAAAAGFDAIELQFPYDQDPLRFKTELETYDLPLVLMNFPVGDLLRGGAGLASVPGREIEFDAALAAARPYAEILRPLAMNLLAGRQAVDQDPDACSRVFKSNLRKAHALTRELGIALVTEPINTVDVPGFFLSGSQQTLDLMDALPDIELRLQYDLYHMQIMEGDQAERLPRIIDRIGHIQFSDAPGRTEPGLGCIDFDAIFELIDALAYEGYVGAEYFPTLPTADTLEWLRRYRS